MRKALLTLLLLMAGPALAQEAQLPAPPAAAPPSVAFEAPDQPSAPAEDTGTPGLPATADGAPTAPALATGIAPNPAPGPAAGTAPGTAPELATAAADSPAAATAVAPVSAAAPESAHASSHTDLLSIVFAAHWVVQAVMAGLAIAAFATLVILIQKLAEFGLAFGKMKRTARLLGQSQTLAGAEAATRGQSGPAAAMIRAAQEELSVAMAEPALHPGVRERTHAALIRIDAGAAQKLRVGTGLLASIGSLSPFIGLFGTVFGIMNAFLAIAETKTTNLAVVAPGIAEALLATAIGLAAAIPAVLIYNICSRKLAKYRHRLADVAAATERLQSRELDRLAAARGA